MPVEEQQKIMRVAIVSEGNRPWLGILVGMVRIAIIAA